MPWHARCGGCFGLTSVIVTRRGCSSFAIDQLHENEAPRSARGGAPAAVARHPCMAVLATALKWAGRRPLRRKRRSQWPAGTAGDGGASPERHRSAADGTRVEGPVSAGRPTPGGYGGTPAASEGGGEAYAVRLSDSGGRPLAGAEVLLLIRMADGTLLVVSLRAGPDPGTYSVTMPPLQSAPVDLRLRVVTNNTRVEIPLMP